MPIVPDEGTLQSEAISQTVGMEDEQLKTSTIRSTLASKADLTSMFSEVKERLSSIETSLVWVRWIIPVGIAIALLIIRFWPEG